MQAGAEFVWGHERQVFMNEPGRAYRKWKSELGLTYRIKAAFGVRPPSVVAILRPSHQALILDQANDVVSTASTSQAVSCCSLTSCIFLLAARAERPRLHRIHPAEEDI